MFRLNGDYKHLQEKLLEAFPFLGKGGGFELTRTNGPYSRQLVPIDSKFLSSISRLKAFVDQARIHVRPLQADLVDVESDHEADGSDQVS